MKLACVNVDLDSLPHYCRIHGLDEGALSEQARGAVYTRALERFLELFAEAGLPATLFAVGRDLADPDAARLLKRAAAAGHEIGNHSLSHDYALVRRSATEMEEEVAAAERAIVDVVGAAPRGFRAPGYTVNAALLKILSQRAYLYDSSVFPSVPYYAAKAAVMGALAVVRRPSRAILDRPRALLAPRLPYRPDLEEPYRAGGSLLWELPITVERYSRMPLIGTTAAALPAKAMAALYLSLRREPFLNFELHGIDLLDASDVGLPSLAAVQRDLRIPVAQKRARLRESLLRLAEGRETVTLAEATARLAAATPPG